MISIHTQTFTPQNKLSDPQKQHLVDFLHVHLQEFGDSKEQIACAIDYALQNYKSFGGFITVLYANNIPIGAVVVNRTGMKGYIPENILVYIAVHANYRGQGFGKLLMQNAIDNAVGDIALHVEPHNPARHLYEKMGLANKYLEMRLKKQ